MSKWDSDEFYIGQEILHEMELHSSIQKQVDEREMLIEEIHKIQETLKKENKRQGVTARVVLDGVVAMLETIIRKLK